MIVKYPFVTILVHVVLILKGVMLRVVLCMNFFTVRIFYTDIAHFVCVHILFVSNRTYPSL